MPNRAIRPFAILALALAQVLALAPGQVGAQAPTFTHADSLRGSNGPARSWWDVTYYDLNVNINPADRSISGWNAITYRVTAAPGDAGMQIDLQAPLSIDSVTLAGRRLSVRQDGNAFFLATPSQQRPDETHTVTVYYHGTPVVAVRPPWDGGFIWAKQAGDAPWVATANQGLGASVWWPNKDFQEEEPDSQRIALTVPDPLMAISNGRLRGTTANGNGTTTYEWFVASPINNYGIAVNAGAFAHWQETFNGMNGPLTLDFWPLAENETAARAQWTQTQPMMRCFEEWFGPYPWYADGFKMIESPHLGMEHQSAIAYGNGYQNGYLGRDLSGSGQGLKWDFIIIHEAAHEWWGNNITTKDVADMWVHESFAAYSENLYTECLTGSKQAGAEYVVGTRANISNDGPIIGEYGVQNQGSGDMYYKGANMLHTIRQLVDDDARWRSVLRGLNRDFARQTVTTAQVEAYIARESGVELDKVFDQYLRSAMIPLLEWRIEGTTLSYRWTDVVEGFDMPVQVRLGAATVRLAPTEEWQSLEVAAVTTALRVNPNYYAKDRATEGDPQAAGGRNPAGS